ncbi:MAG: MATE family efflux transporter [Natronospirillum sp.]
MNPNAQPHTTQKQHTIAEYRTVVAISLPLLVYYLSEVAIGLTDLFIVGQLGTLELGAVGLGKTLVFGWLMVSLGILSIISVMCSEALAQRRITDMTLTLVQGIWIAAALVGLGILLFSYTTPLFNVLGYDPAVTAVAEEYILWAKWMLLPALAFGLLRNYLTVVARTRVLVAVSLTAVAANYGLNQLLVFGRYGFPELGVTGAAVATVVVNVFSFVVLFFYTRWSEPRAMRAVLARLLQLHPARIMELLRLGLPAGMVQSLEAGFFIIISLLVGTFGAVWLAANNVMLAVMDVTFVIMLTLGEALAVRLAFQQGLGNRLLLQALTRFGLVVGGVIMLSASALLWLRPDWVLSFFLDSNADGYAETLAATAQLAAIMAIFLLFDGYQVLTTWMLRGFKDTFIPMLLGASGYWAMGLSFGLILAYPIGLGAVGLWWGLGIGLMFAASLLVLRLINRAWGRG